MQFSNLEIPCQQFLLDNGLTLVVHEDRKTPIVALNIWYHVGSKNEKPGKTGFAHLFEHLMFGGSEHLQGSYIEAMERIGATDLNGTTSEDRTNYFENIPSSALDYALFAESDRMGYFYNTISQELLDLQRGVVKNEKRQGENQPYAIVEDLVVKSTYPTEHPYAHTVIGSMEDLDSATLEDVREWFKTYYTPSNAVLVVAGDISADEAHQKVRRYFNEIAPGPPIAHQRAWVAKMTGEHRETVEDRVPQARIYKVWNTPGYGTATADHLRFTAGILSSGKNSRLYKRLVYDDQIATQVSAYLDEREIGSQFAIVATARQGQDLRRIEQAVDEELARFLQDGPTERELARVKAQFYAGFVRGVERIGGFGGKSDILATSLTYSGSPHSYKNRLERLESLGGSDLRDSAREWLADGVYVLEVHPFAAARPSTEPVNRAALPALGSPHELKLPAIQEDRLSNGLRILLAERHEIPVVNLWLDVNAGYSADHGILPGTAKLASALLTGGGTRRRTALEISDELQMLGAQVTSGCNLDMSTVYLSSLKPTLDQGLDLFADVVLNPVFPQLDFERQQQLQLAAIAHEKVTPLQMGLRALPPLLFGSQHAYGIPLTGSGTEDSVQQMTREDTARFHGSWFKPNNATLIVVGDTTLAEMKPKLEKLFAGWAPGDVPAKKLNPVPRPANPAIYIVDKPGALHSVVIGGTVAPPVRVDDEIALETMNNVFGGAFGARLNMNLREDKHWSYGAGSVLFGARAQRPFLAYASVQGDKTADSIAEILSELQGMTGAKPVTSAELDKVKQQQIFELPGSHETMNSIGTLLGDLLQFNLPLDFYDTYVSRVSALTVSEIEAAAKAILDPEHMIWMVVGDRAQLEPALRSLGIGELIPTQA